MDINDFDVLTMQRAISNVYKRFESTKPKETELIFYIFKAIINEYDRLMNKNIANNY